jgi:hypothetical protein
VTARPYRALASDAPTRLFPHEWAFATLYAVVIICLARAPGHHPGVIAAWVLLAGVSAGVIAVTARPTALWEWRVRFALLFLVMNAVYGALGPAVRATGTPYRDGFLQWADVGLFGAMVPTYLDRFARPGLTELFSGCYFLLYPYLLVSCVRYLSQPADKLEAMQRFVVGLFFIYGVGYLGYFLVPAIGPGLSFPGAFHHPLGGYWMTRLNTTLVSDGTDHVDVYPSLHVALSCFILLFDRRYARRWFRICVVPVVGLWIATLYLRYHYGFDVVSGFALAAIGLWVAGWCRTTPFAGEELARADEPVADAELVAI